MMQTDSLKGSFLEGEIPMLNAHPRVLIHVTTRHSLAFRPKLINRSSNVTKMDSLVQVKNFFYL